MVLRASFLASLSLVSLLAGCGTTGSFTNKRVPTAKSAEDIGSVGLAVLSVSRWQDVAGELESRFNTDEKQLLGEALPITSTVTDRIVDAMVARLGINLAGTAINDSSTLTNTAKSSSTSSTDAAGTVTDLSSSEDGSTSEDKTSRTRTTPGAATLPDTAAGGAAALGTPPARVSGVDAFTRYTAANALKQELVVLNRYVRDAAQRTGYEPFLVRLQFSVHPRMREQPFDTVMRVSFLPSEVPVPASREAEGVFGAASQKGGLGPSTFAALFGLDQEKAPATAWEGAVAANSYTDFAALFSRLRGGSSLSGFGEDASSYTLTVRTGDDRKTYTILKPCFFRHMPEYLNSVGITPKRSYDDFAASARFAPALFDQLEAPAKALEDTCVPTEASLLSFETWRGQHRSNLLRLPVVVPLVVTDNLEGTKEYQAAQNLRQAALALSAIGGPASANASFSKTMDRLREYEATRLNSIYSIGRLSENTVQVRLGASRFGGRYEMVPRTVQSTLLLLVPREQAGRMVELVARPSFNNAETGVILRLTSDRAGDERYKFAERQIDEAAARRMCGAQAKAAATTFSECRSFLTRLSRLTVEPDGWSAFYTALDVVPAQEAQSTVWNRTQFCRDGGSTNPLCAEDLWAELQREQQRIATMSRARVEIPRLKPRDLPPLQTVSAKLAGTTDKITVVGIDPWLKPNIRARVTADCRARNSDGVFDGYLATSLDVSGEVGTFSAPRPKGEAAAVEPRELCLWLDNSAYAPLTLGVVDGSSPAFPRVYPIRFVKEEEKKDGGAAAKPAFELAISGQTVVTQRNKGTVRLVVRNFDKEQIDRIVFAAEDGVIVGASGNATFEGKTYTAVIASDGAVELPVESIDTQDRKVRIRADGMKGDKVIKTSHADVQLREGNDS